MTLNNVLPLLIVSSALLSGLVIFCLGNAHLRLRRAVNLGGNVLCLSLIAVLVGGVYAGGVYETRLPLLPGMDLVLHADALSLLFVSLSGILWLLTTIYAIGYLEGTANRSRFFGFFSLCVAATLGIALAGNLITFLIFYELLTLTTYPLVVHKGNPASLRAGRIYLTYTMIGGALLLAGVVWLKALAGPLDFTATGILSGMPHLDPGHLKMIFALLIAGLGVKAALVPLHGWLPVAMAAPAPVSALLHAVAVVKAGAFGIVRVVYDVYGIEFARDLGLTSALAGLAAFTIVYGSVRALTQDDLKKRLAFSTVSQVSYIALGTAIAGPIATIGGMVHLVHQGLMKITLFFCAGNLAETVGIHKVSEMDGVGRRMPLTMAAFTIAALGMIGLPPVAGFVSKWYLGTGALEVNAYWVLGILAASSLLNAAYFLPILQAAWFRPPTRPWSPRSGALETQWMLLLPPVVTAGLALAAGVFASSLISPSSWTQLIAAREYGDELVRAAVAIDLTGAPLWIAVLSPLVLASGLLLAPLRRLCVRLTPWAAVPALLSALLLAGHSQALPGLFFGSTLAIDQSSQVMLLLASALWLIAGVYGNDYLRGDSHLARYNGFFLLCMTGSFGLILSQDLFGFITFFTLMSLAAYGLVTHSGSDQAMRAGKTYMQWVVIGEVLLFAALIGLALNGGSDSLTDIDKRAQPLWVTWLLVLGFGIKAGLLATHFWLPRAHPVAPVPASALLSGLMVKAGLLGWWRFLPLGDATLVDVGTTMIWLGFGGAFLAVLAGVGQRNPKTLLAYSTISQMGILAAGIGAGLLNPTLWPVLSAALVLYAVHHGLAKTALFLSVGLAPRLAGRPRLGGLFWLSMLIPALAMAGWPLTNGALAKAALKSSLASFDTLPLLLAVSAIGTTVLMLRFVDLMRRVETDSSHQTLPARGSLGAFAALLVMIVGALYWLPQAAPFADSAFSYKGLWSALWPIVIGAALFFVSRTYLAKATPIPAGDFIVLLESAQKNLRRLARALGPRFDGRIVHDMGRISPAARMRDAVLPSSTQVHPGVVFIGILIGLALALFHWAVLGELINF